MNLKDPKAMNDILGNVLRFGVILSAIVIAFGFLVFVARYSLAGTASYIQYYSNRATHGNFSVSLSSMASGLVSLNAFSIIELGLLILLATPVSRVFLSIVLFDLEGDRKYVYITVAVFLILLFSMIVTPFIPSFGG
ncbi:MAG: DUF1634 domain-containing protein [archaeon]|jgi:uncharacterized membrane protein|nr:DUF1634 domain-containing protein [archaeon]